MKTFDFNTPLLGFDNEPVAISDSNPELAILGKLLAPMLAQAQTDDPQKTWGWAQMMFMGTPLILDESDTERLTKIIKELKQATDMLKAQAFKILKG